MNLRIVLGKNIVMFRQLRGMNQEDLSKRCGVSVRTLGRIEDGRHNPRLTTLEAIAKPLGLDIEWLFTQNEIRQVSPEKLRPGFISNEKDIKVNTK